MLPTLAKLKLKCNELGLVATQKGKREAKSDYVSVLRKHFLDIDYPEGLPYEEVTPALCFASWNLKPHEERNALRGPGWVAQKKENGCRLIMHFHPSGVFAHSRTVSVKSFRYQELSSKLLFSDFTDSDQEIVLDLEAIIEKSVDTRPYTAKGEVTKSSLHSTTAVLSLDKSKQLQTDQDAPLTFKVIDIVRFRGKDFRRSPYRDRLVAIEEFFKWLKGRDIEKYFIHCPVVYDNREAYLNQILADGGEGVVMKNLNAVYMDSSSRRRDVWVKFKRRKEFDCFVTGFKRGEPDAEFRNLVGALEFSINLEEGGTHVLGFPINMTLEFRKAISIYDPASDSVSLRPDMLGRVAEISGQDVSARELRLSHCTLDRWRDQMGDVKHSDDCVTSISDLRTASEWVK